jgi:hypothetical protein
MVVRVHYAVLHKNMSYSHFQLHHLNMCVYTDEGHFRPRGGASTLCCAPHKPCLLIGTVSTLLDFVNSNPDYRARHHAVERPLKRAGSHPKWSQTTSIVVWATGKFLYPSLPRFSTEELFLFYRF